MQIPVAILSKLQISEYLKSIDLIPLIEQGFEAYSKGDAVVPPVGELLFEDPPGEAHIKYGYIKNQQFYAVKIASGFYNNQALGLKASQGVILLFSQQSGALVCVLLDGGMLTDIRTTIASMITLKYMAPTEIGAIGIMGTGIQAKLQLEYLDHITQCKNIFIWGRNKDKCEEYIQHFKDSPFEISVAKNASDLAANCNVIITTTAAKSPILNFQHLQPGTHITALGSDTSEKIELDPEIIKNCDIVVSDSIPQSKSRGEVYQSRLANCLNSEKLVELGNIIGDPKTGRLNNKQMTIADLTGVAVQDIMIATAIYNHHLNHNPN